MRSRPRQVLVALATLAVLVVFATGAVAADNVTDAPPEETLPVDSETAGTDASDIQRTVPREQVPFGVRTMYGQERLVRPSGGSDVTVAVLDTGVDRTHPDLQDRVTLCRDFTGERVTNTCTDRNGHGTHVAGTVAADGGSDDRGIYGVAPEAEIYAFKTCNDDGVCPTDALAQAIRAATDAGADVIVMSLGGRSEPRVESETRRAADRGTVVIAAAGNNGPDIGSILYPAGHPHVIGVGAVGPRSEDRVAPDNYRVPDFSARGINDSYREADDYLDVAAPGVSVLSPVPDGGYARKSGTSMAAPHIAGLAAKQLGAPNPPESNRALRAELRNRAPRFDVTQGTHTRLGYDPAAGFGIPTIAPPESAFVAEPEVPTANEEFVLDAGASRAPDSEITSYEWDITGDGTFDREGERIELTREAGTYVFTLRVTDSDGNTARTIRAVRVNAPPVAAFAVEPSIPTEGERATFDATASHDPDGSDLSYVWDVTGDGTTDATSPVVERAFNDPGIRDVELRVTDSDGATDEVVRELLVNDIPGLSVSVPESVRANEATTLEATVDNRYGTTTVTWRFPDGTTARGETATHEFSEGNSTVEVTVEDEFGATTTETVTVTATGGILDQGPAVPYAIIAILIALGLAAYRRRSKRMSLT